MSRPLDPTLSLSNDKYKQKFTFEERCFIYAAYLHGASWAALARFFGVHRRTVEMIDTGPPYKNVRDERGRLGDEAFIEKYLDHEKLERIREFVAKVREGDPEFATVKQSVDPNQPNWYANKTATAKRGPHKERNLADGSMFDFYIEWRGAVLNKKQGWYWYSLDGKHESTRPYSTSQEAFDASRDVWDPKNGPTALSVQHKVEELQVLRSNAARARAHMEANPSKSSVDYFVQCATSAMRAEPTFTEADIEATLADREFWRGFDPTPFGHTLSAS